MVFGYLDCWFLLTYQICWLLIWLILYLNYWLVKRFYDGLLYGCLPATVFVSTWLGIWLLFIWLVDLSYTLFFRVGAF